MKIDQRLSGSMTILVLSWVLIISGCSPSGQSASSQNLPAALQAIATDTPAGDGAWMYPIPGPRDSFRSLAAWENGIYAVNRYDRGASWRTEAMQWGYGIVPSRVVKLLASGGDGCTLYVDTLDGVWRLDAESREAVRIGGPADIEELAASADSKVVYAKVGDSLWWWKEGDTQWQQMAVKEDGDFSELEFSFGIEFEGDWTVGANGAYRIGVDILEELYSGTPADYAFDLEHWWIEANVWENLGWNMGHSAGKLAVSGDGEDPWMRTGEGEIWARGRMWSIDDPALAGQPITALLFDPNEQAVLYLGTPRGLYFQREGSTSWKLAAGPGQGRAVNAIVYHSGWRVPLVATDNGVYFVILQSPIQLPQQRSALAEAWEATTRFYKDNSQKAWFWPVTALSGFSTTYLLGIAALLLLAWRGGSKVFSRTWLSSIAAKPLLITPGLGQWTLFLGYKRRLTRNRAVIQASKDYFGLPAEDSNGSIVLPDPTGESLHERISQELGPQQPVLIIGKGGAGKSTLLARWAYLALKGQLPASLKGYRPVLVNASYYTGNLVRAVADILQERDGVAVNEELMRVQLQSGRYLILFDGVSEVETDQQQSLREILRAAHDAGFQDCRFLIATRPLEGIPAEVSTFHLRSLTPDVISVLLPRYGLSREHQEQVRQQLQSFGERPIEPLLFTMALAQSGAEQVSASRAQLYERYFRRLLRTEKDETLWSGWRAALEAIAQWFLFETGRRGIGLPHEPFVDLMAGMRDGTQAAEKLVEMLRRYYHLPVKDELDLLKQLRAAGLLQGGRRWRFTHDTFEEYFAASSLVSCFDREEQWPHLGEWIGSPERERDFLDVLEFVREMIDEPTRHGILSLDLPSSWKEHLKQEKGPK